MRASILLLLAPLACSSASGPSASGTVERRTVLVGAETRSYLVSVPEGVSPAGAGLIVAFHGARGTAEGLRAGTDLDRVGQETGSVVAYPDADHANWAEDCGCIAADGVHGVVDTVLVSAILDDLTADLGLDPSRRFAVGFSQGGMFVQRLACQMAERFGAFAVVAATMSVPLSERCDPGGPVSLLLVISQDDPVFPWLGSRQGSFSTLGAAETAWLWHEISGCDDAYARVEEDFGVRHVYGGCAGGARVELVGPAPGGHAWSMSPLLDTGDEVARFFGG